MEIAMKSGRRCVASPQTMEVGRILPKFVTPSDVRDLKIRVDGFVRALDESVAACGALPAGVADGWKAFSAAWRTYFDEEDSWWHTAAQMDQGEAYEQDVAHWQQMIAGYKCTTDAPAITPQDPPVFSGDGGGQWSGTIKWVAIAAVAVAVVMGVKAVAR
jgi:hypothetical protein